MRRVALELHEFHAGQIRWPFGQWLIGRFPDGGALPRPDLIIGAGHRTHAAMLSARRAWGGKIVVLMRPSLPLAWFDFAVVPQHDRPAALPGVIPTTGVLNTIQPTGNASETKGLILIGGPSKHYAWQDTDMATQVEERIRESPGVDWQLTTSRRTPPRTLQLLRALDSPRLQVIPFEATARGWVRERLAACGRVWVSEDSVSMVFEALTAGGQVGLLRVPPKTDHSRVRKAVASLVEEGRVMLPGQAASATMEQAPLAEADRVAEVLLERCFSK